jgi:sugar lactone lactonase YvrE
MSYTVYQLGRDAKLRSPQNLALDASDNVFVTDGDALDEFSAGTYGDVEPRHRLYGHKTGLSAADGVAVDSSGDIYVAIGVAQGKTEAGVNEYPPGAKGHTAPINAFSGTATTLQSPQGITIR